MSSLADLAQRTTDEGEVKCTFTCAERVNFADNLIATQLYLIAQEAVHNAIKHGNPSRIGIQLDWDLALRLRIQDDGIGFNHSANGASGLGLRIMRDRATIIGAKLTIEPGRPNG